MQRLLMPVALAATLLFGTQAQGQIIASYQYSSPDSSSTTNNANPGLTLSNFSLSRIAILTSPEGWYGQTWAISTYIPPSQFPPEAAGYGDFSLEADATHKFDVTSITFNNATNAPGTTSYLLQYSLDGGTNFSIYQSGVSVSGGLLKFSSGALTGLLNYGDDVKFRLSVVDSNASELKFGNDPQNASGLAVTFGGSVQAVPEPGSMILTGLAFAGSAGVGFLRRRKAKGQEVVSEQAQAV